MECHDGPKCRDDPGVVLHVNNAYGVRSRKNGRSYYFLEMILVPVLSDNLIYICLTPGITALWTAPRVTSSRGFAVSQLIWDRDSE